MMSLVSEYGKKQREEILSLIQKHNQVYPDYAIKVVDDSSVKEDSPELQQLKNLVAGKEWHTSVSAIQFVKSLGFKSKGSGLFSDGRFYATVDLHTTNSGMIVYRIKIS